MTKFVSSGHSKSVWVVTLVQQDARPDNGFIPKYPRDCQGQFPSEHPESDFIFKQSHEIGDRCQSEPKRIAGGQRRFLCLAVDRTRDYSLF